MRRTRHLASVMVLTAAAMLPQAAPWPHEPPGMTVIVDRPFSCPAETPNCEQGWAFSQGYPEAFQIVIDSNAPKSPPYVAQQMFTPRLQSGSSPAITEKSFLGPAARKMIYVAFYAKLSPNFPGHPTSTNKIVHFVIGGGNKIYVMARGAGNGPLVPAFGLQGIAVPYNDRRQQTATSVNLLPNVANVSIVRGAWQLYEVVLTANSAGQANGSAELWIDGNKALSYGGIGYVSDDQRWTAVQWSPTWGGAGGVVQQAFTMQFDHLYISGK